MFDRIRDWFVLRFGKTSELESALSRMRLARLSWHLVGLARALDKWARDLDELSRAQEEGVNALLEIAND